MTKESYDYLSTPAQKALSLDDEERIRWTCRTRWIGYARAQEIITKLENLLLWPQTSRMPNLLVIGQTNNGKTTIVERFTQKHPADENVGGDFVNVPVLLIQAPPCPDEGRLYNSILDKLFAPYKSTDHVSRKQQLVLAILKKAQLKMLVIDEIHHILAGHYDKQRQFLNVIKYLGNELKIPIIAVGTKEALRAIQSDPQLANRFEPMAIPRWNLDKNFLKLLASFESILPLKRKSNLTQKDIAVDLLSRSEGKIGELSMLLNRATDFAIRSGEECITKATIDQLGWVSPSERRKQAETII